MDNDSITPIPRLHGRVNRQREALLGDICLRGEPLEQRTGKYGVCHLFMEFTFNYFVACKAMHHHFHSWPYEVCGRPYCLQHTPGATVSLLPNGFSQMATVESIGELNAPRTNLVLVILIERTQRHKVSS